MKYLASGTGNRHFEIVDERQKAAGTLDYTTWFPNKAKVTTGDGNIYEMAPQGFWRTTIGMTKNGLPFAALKAKMGSQIVLSFEQGITLLFKRKSLWNSNYVVVDSQEQEVAFIQPDFKWKNLSFNYEIDIYANNLDRDINAILPLVLVYCNKYIRMRHSAVH